jgi:RNA polymerase sigma factor (sigma-70 family)
MCAFGSSQKASMHSDNTEKYYQQILNYCKKHLGYDRIAAEECAQGVYTAYYESVQRITIIEPRAWLYRTADNYINRYVRMSYIEKRRTIPFDYLSGNEIKNNMFSYDPDLDIVMEKDIDVEEYKDKVLNSLTVAQRRLYNQYFKNHISIKDLAEIYGISIDAVWARIHRLKKHIIKNVERQL